MEKKEAEPLRIDCAEEDINYFNGFRNAVKLLNHQIQYLEKALDEVPEDVLRNTMREWSKVYVKDMDNFVQKMYGDLKVTYGMSLRIDANDNYYLKIDDGNQN